MQVESSLTTKRFDHACSSKTARYRKPAKSSNIFLRQKVKRVNSGHIVANMCTGTRTFKQTGVDESKSSLPVQGDYSPAHESFAGLLGLEPVQGSSSWHMEKEILTIEEAAEYLQIGKRSVYKLAKEGTIPGKKILNKWRFEKGSLREWVREGKGK